jgi:hypothetical protein
VKATPESYRSCNPRAFALYLAGDVRGAVNAYLHGDCFLIVEKGEDGHAEFYASERQKSVGQLRAASEHEKETDRLCCAYRAKEDKIDNFYQTEEGQRLIKEIDARRQEWQKMFGVYYRAKHDRLMAIRAKRFLRTMRLAKK